MLQRSPALRRALARETFFKFTYSRLCLTHCKLLISKYLENVKFWRLTLRLSLEILAWAPAYVLPNSLANSRARSRSEVYDSSSMSVTILLVSALFLAAALVTGSSAVFACSLKYVIAFRNSSGLSLNIPNPALCLKHSSPLMRPVVWLWSITNLVFIPQIAQRPS